MAKIKGMCRNEDCEMCDQKQEAEKSNFKCEKCGKDLIPFGNKTSEPGSGPNKKLIAIIAGVVVLLAIIGSIIALSGSGEEAPKQEPVAVAPVDSDSIKAAQMAAENQKLKDSLAAVEAAKAKEGEQEEGKVKEPVKPQNGYVTNYNIGYGTYTGDIKNGKPHGHGTITYRSSHAITGGIQASPGDKYEGDFRDGRVSGGIGYWTHNGNMQTINP